MTTFREIFLLIVKERKSSKFHQMALKSMDYTSFYAVVLIHAQNQKNSLPEFFATPGLVLKYEHNSAQL